MTPHHDLRHALAWVPVTYLDGRTATLALQPLLEQAHLIEEVTADAGTWAALMRFLPTVTALIARRDPTADFDAWARTGIPAPLIDTALDAVASHLWLIHPDTPFLQEPRLVISGTGNDTEWLHLTHPGASSKAWWGKPGDHGHPEAGTPARVAQGLLVSWFFSPGVGGQATGAYTDRPEETWRPRGTTSFTSHGLRVFWRGANLAHTLLANTMEAHARTPRRGGGANLPLWACPGDVTPAAGELTAATWTGSVYLLEHDGTRFTAVHTGGRRVPGITGDRPTRAAATKELERHLWRADPTIARAPIRKAGQDTGKVRTIKALHPSASGLHWAAEWYATDNTRGITHPQTPGLVDADQVDVFALRLEGLPTAPEVGYLTRIGQASDILAPAARTRLTSLSAQILSPLAATLWTGVRIAFGAESARAHFDRVYAAFCAGAEDVLDDILHAEHLTRADAGRIIDQAVHAFSAHLEPYMTPSALAAGDEGNGIAAALAYVERRARASTREVSA